MSKRDNNHTEEEDEEEEDEQEYKVAHTHMHTPKENKENSDFSRQKTKTKENNGGQKQSKGYCRIELGWGLSRGGRGLCSNPLLPLCACPPILNKLKKDSSTHTNICILGVCAWSSIIPHDTHIYTEPELAAGMEGDGWRNKWK